MHSNKRSSVGRSAELGQFYNARDDSLIQGYSLFKTEIPASLIKAIDTPNTHYKYSVDDSLEKKLATSNIDGQLKASFLAGLVSVNGSGKYLLEQKKSFRSVSASMVYEIRTKSERISLNNEKLQELVSKQALEAVDATHVVVGIEWGAKSIASFEYENTENSDKSQIEGKLRGAFSKISQALGGVDGSPSGDLDLTEEERKVVNRVTINYYSDFASAGRLPTTIEETVNVMRDVPSLISKSNNGKGVALELSLMPISELERLLGLQTKLDRKLVELDDHSIDRVQQELDKFLVQKQRFNDAKKEIDANAQFFSDSVLDLWLRKDESIQQSESGFRSRLKSLLVAIRSDVKDPSKLESFVQDFQRDDSNNSFGIQQFLTANSKTLSRLQVIRDYRQLGIQFLAKQENLDHFILMERDKDVYVLVCGDQIAVQDSANYKLNRQFFMQLLHEKAQSGAIFLAYDVELHAVNNNPEESRAAVVYFSNGAKVDDDCRKSFSSGRLIGENSE